MTASQYHVRFSYLSESKISDIEYGGDTKASLIDSSRVEYIPEQRKSYMRFLKTEITQAA